jgi:hypothetical protein
LTAYAKAKVEVGVQIVQRWILARLRDRRFFSLTELNRAIRELVDQLNDRPMRGCNTTRRALFEQPDRPALLALPPTPYEYADWKRCRVSAKCTFMTSMLTVGNTKVAPVQGNRVKEHVTNR